VGCCEQGNELSDPIIISTFLQLLVGGGGGVMEPSYAKQMIGTLWLENLLRIFCFFNFHRLVYCFIVVFSLSITKIIAIFIGCI
jgi:hypothetical protein